MLHKRRWYPHEHRELSVSVKLVVVALVFTVDLHLWMAVVADLGTLLLVLANGVRPLAFFA